MTGRVPAAAGGYLSAETGSEGAKARAELAYYRANCGCDVSQLILPDTGRLFMAHRSLPMGRHTVFGRLSAHGIAPGLT